jgi:hypothetical protein
MMLIYNEKKFDHWEIFLNTNLILTFFALYELFI